MKPNLFTLKNGMRVLLEENHVAPVVALQALITVGSADEKEEEAGICHMIEHMLFKGTKKRKVGEIAQDVEAAGGDINAYTSFDQTVYYISMATRFMDVGLDILADAIQNPTFDKEELEKEKEVILEEIRRERDNPQRYISEILFQKAYDQHTYGRPIIGFEKTVKGVTQETLFHFFHRWYVPENTFFLVVGDFETEAMLKKIEAAFHTYQNLNWDRPVTPRQPESKQRETKWAIQTDNIQSVHFSLSFHIPEITHDDIPSLDILSHILGGSESSRFEQTLKEKKHLVQSIHAYAYAPKDPGLFIIGGHLNTDKGPKAFQTLWEEVERFQQEGPTPEELKRAKLNIRASEIYEKETVGGQAGKYSYFLATAGQIDFEKKFFQQVQAATTEEITDVCRRYLSKENLTVALLVPEKEFKKPWEDQIRKSLTAIQGPSAKQKKLKGATKAKPQLLVLPNGVRLILQEDHSLPIVSLCLATLNGLRAETPATNGIFHLMSQTLTKGSKRRSALEIVEKIESMAGSLEGFSGKNTYGLRSEFLSDYSEAAIHLFFEVLLEPAWDPKEVAKEKRLTLEAIKNQEDALAQLAFHYFQKTLYPSHPYGMRTIGSRQSIPKLTPQQLDRCHRQALMGKSTVVSLVGDFQTDAMVTLLKEKLESLPKKGAAFRSPPIDPKPSKIQEVLFHREKQQAHLVLGFLADRVTDKSHYALVVLNTLLSGMGGRLFMELRDKRGLAYTVTSSLMEGFDPGYLAAYIGTEPAKVPQAIEGIKRELQKIQTEKVEIEEFRRTQNYLVGTYELSLQRSATRAQSYAFNELYGLGFQEVDRYPSKILEVQTEDVLKVAQHYIHLNAYVLSQVKPK